MKYNVVAGVQYPFNKNGFGHRYYMRLKLFQLYVSLLMKCFITVTLDNACFGSMQSTNRNANRMLRLSAWHCSNMKTVNDHAVTFFKEVTSISNVNFNVIMQTDEDTVIFTVCVS